MLPAVKVVLAAESVNVIVAVWLFLSVVAGELIVTVGDDVFTANESDAAAFVLPAASVNVPASTEIVAAPLKPVVGVKVAV